SDRRHHVLTRRNRGSRRRSRRPARRLGQQGASRRRRDRDPHRRPGRLTAHARAIIRHIHLEGAVTSSVTSPATNSTTAAVTTAMNSSARVSHAPVMLDDDPFELADKTFTSRLIMGTGGAPSLSALESALLASGTELTTVALRRIAPGTAGSVFDLLSALKI